MSSSTTTTRAQPKRPGIGSAASSRHVTTGPQRGARVAGSPAMLAQRRRISRSFGDAVQLAEAGRFLADAGGPVGEGKLDKDEFLARMQALVLAASKEILGPLGMAQDNCPDLKYWVSHYEGKDAAHVEQVIARYAPATQDAADCNEYLSLLVQRIREGLVEHARTGAGLDPEPVPKSIEKERPPFDEALLQRRAAPVAQLNCFSSSSSKDDDDRVPQQDDRRGRSIGWKDDSSSEGKKPVRKFTKEDAFKATRPNKPESSTLTKMFELTGGELHDAFGIDEDSMHHRMDSILKSNDFGASIDAPEKGRVEFSNLFSSTGWVMAENFKDPDLAEDNLYMSDVVDYQWQQSGVQDDEGGLKYLARKHIISKNGKAFFEKYKIKDNTDMTKVQLDEFLRNTPNGKSSVRILQQHDERLDVVSAHVFNRHGSYSVVLRLRRGDE